MSEPVSGVERREDLLIPVLGETVAATRYRPTDADGPLPALLTYSPYHKDDFATFGSYEPTLTYLALAGYEVVAADLVGTGASSGFKREPDTMVEGKEAAAIVDWLAAQEWTTGRVGMFGKSYAATTSLKAAMEAPEALRAIVPIHGPHTGYREAHEGGSFAFYRMGGDWTPYMHALAARPPSRRDAEGRWAEVWQERLDGLRETDPWLFQYLDHQTRDEYWAEKDVPLDSLSVPTFAVCGWRDAYARSTIEYYRATDAPKRLLLGPWGHEMPHKASEAAIDFRRQVVEWFDHFLKDEENGALDRPKLAVWTGLGETDRGTWRGLDAWPEAEDPGVSLALTPDGLVPTESYAEGALEATYEYDHTVGMESLDGVYFSSDPVDTNADDARSLTFETPPLERSLELTGTGEARLRVTATTADPMVVVRVVDVAPDGSASMVAHGELQASHRDGDADPAPLTPGKEYELTVPLTPKSHVFGAGHRVRVAVSNASFPLTFPTREQGATTLRSDPEAPSRVVLPGVEHDGSVTFEDAVEMAPPDESVPTTGWRATDARTAWETAREHVGDAARVTMTDEGTLDLPHVDLESSVTAECRVAARDPTTATVTSDVEMTLDYGTETVRVESTSRVTRDLAQLWTRVTVEDHPVFEETWRR